MIQFKMDNGFKLDLEKSEKQEGRDFSILKEFNAFNVFNTASNSVHLSDKEKLELALQDIKKTQELKVNDLQSQKAKAIWKRTALLMNNAQTYLEREIKRL